MKKIIYTLIALVFLTACSNRSENKLTLYNKSTITAGFDTTITIMGYTKDEETFDEYFQLAHDTFSKYNELFDIYNTYPGVNNLMSVNENAGIEPVAVDPLIIDMLKMAKEYTEISPYFNVTYGAVFNIWHDYREEGIELNTKGEPGRVPTLEELKEAEKYTGWDKVVIDDVNNTVYLKEKGVRLDVGAIAKGLATELVAQKLETEGLEHGIISGGGNIRTINNKPDGPWKIGVQEPSPEISAPSIDIFSLEESMSVVTSGDYQRTYYGPDNVMYSHLINPKTLFPQNSFRSVTVVMENSALADIFSTSMYMMEFDEANTFIEEYNIKYPEDKLEVFWVMDENEDWYQYDKYDYTMTEGLKPLSHNLNE